MVSKANSFVQRHFIMIPFEDEGFVNAYKQLYEDICKQNLKDFDKELLQKPGKLHMTVSVLDLNEDPALIKKVDDILASLNQKMKDLAQPGIDFNFERFETMGDCKKTRIVYGKMLQDENEYRLCDIIDLIIRNLVDANIIPSDTLADKHIEYTNGKYTITLHLTLMNVLFWNKIRKKEKKKDIKNIDATEILKYMSNTKLASCHIKKINFCLMREDKKTEKYELVKSYEI